MISRKVLPVSLVAMFASTSVQAGVIFFIPGAGISKMHDVLTGSHGEFCVSKTTKVGDVTRSVVGNTKTVMSLSGTSSRCNNPEMPIRAMVELGLNFVSKAKFELPERYVTEGLSDFEKFNGTLLIAHAAENKSSIRIEAHEKQPTMDPIVLAQEYKSDLGLAIGDVMAATISETRIKGVRVLRIEAQSSVEAKPSFLYTIMEGPNEIFVIKAWSKTADFKSNRATFINVSELATGIGTDLDQK
jgi:hypothetical protein